MNVRSAIQDTVSISQFNRGRAGQIFEDVKNTGAKVVMKNNVPECVLISPSEYIDMLDMLCDADLLATAHKRMSRFEKGTTLSQEDIDKHFGLTEADYEGWEDIEIE